MAFMSPLLVCVHVAAYWLGQWVEDEMIVHSTFVNDAHKRLQGGVEVGVKAVEEDVTTVVLLLCLL
jgi:hypothetical protein